VTPRVAALVIALPLLTVAADLFGLFGGGIIAYYLYGLDTNSYVTSLRLGITIQDILGGIIKPIFFGFIIGMISCHKGLTTQGGTVGVGRSTTDAVVLSSITVIIVDFFLSKLLQGFFGNTLF
jgi:phospholipid/cholesterol/gamma-HCH transport system permease protein